MKPLRRRGTPLARTRQLTPQAPRGTVTVPNRNKPVGRHRVPKRSHSALRGGLTKSAAVASAAVAVPALALGGAPAHAATGSTWNQLSKCESGGNWHINTGNGFYGGLQFSASTWKAFGGGKYAPRADQASKSEQISVAEKVLDAQGWGAWPSCSSKLGLTSADAAGSPGVAPAADESGGGSHKGGGDYTVKSGDTLSEIAHRFDVKGGWHALWKKNRDVVGSNPNALKVGTHLDVR